MEQQTKAPSAPFVAASWAALAVGVVGFLGGLMNAPLVRLEKFFYFTLLMYGLFSAVSLQKVVRDRHDGLPVTGIYYGLCWFSLGFTLVMLSSALLNSSMSGSERGFYSMAFALALFGSVVVQKNVRDLAAGSGGGISS
ncbi:MAG: inner membrane protein YiaA [Actinomycetota bacterium]